MHPTLSSVVVYVATQLFVMVKDLRSSHDLECCVRSLSNPCREQDDPNEQAYPWKDGSSMRQASCRSTRYRRAFLAELLAHRRRVLYTPYGSCSSFLLVADLEDATDDLVAVGVAWVLQIGQAELTRIVGFVGEQGGNSRGGAVVVEGHIGRGRWEDCVVKVGDEAVIWR